MQVGFTVPCLTLHSCAFPPVLCENTFRFTYEEARQGADAVNEALIQSAKSRGEIQTDMLPYGVFSNAVIARSGVAPRRSNPAGSPRRGARLAMTNRFEDTP